MLSIQKVSRKYNNEVVLNNITFSILHGEKVGLVAPNGIGKSTLLKIIAGEDEYDSGFIAFQKGIKIAYFPQEICLNISIAEYFKSTDGGDGAILNIFKYVGLEGVQVNTPIEKLSGGQRSKVALVRILLTKSDIYLLDEPTNNLDFATLKILEEFIISSSSAFIIISHDREFLDRTVNKIFEIDEFTHALRIYGGGYSEYLKQKEARIFKELANYEDAQTKSKKIKKAIEKKMGDIKKINKEVKNRSKLGRNITDKKSRVQILDRAGKIARQSKSIKNRLQTLHLDEVEKPKSRLTLKLQFDKLKPSGSKVFSIINIEKNIGDKHLGPINLDVQYGDRILILGDNGVGKTTFLKILLEKVAFDSGEIKKGTKLYIGYLPQITDKNQNDTVLSFFTKQIPGKSEEDIRKILNRFNLTQNDVSKTLNELSPGLRSRLIFATMMTIEPNCLILDEPSNHLDLEVLEKLEDALVKYRGTIILVSHDRKLIKKLEFTKIYNLSNKGILEEVVDIDKFIEGI